uniref:Type Ia crustin cruIa-1 n=1 Tax=Penaeus vannamei TaxID=6689 RepID=A0A7L9R3H1_PENVA|nr:uncharacterized protein LOC113829403 [Penaeus vannamei]QOL09942.1 type Ia crustin cruIa-1 [Penaeus vannamei]
MLRVCIMLVVLGAVCCQKYPDPLVDIDCTNWCNLSSTTYYCCDEDRNGSTGKCPATPISKNELDILSDLGNHNALNCKFDRECEVGEKCCYAKESQHYRICRFAF